MARESLTIFTETADHWGEGWALLLLGNCLNLAFPAEASGVYQTGLTLCKESGDQIVLSYLSLNMAVAMKDLGQYVQSQHHADLAVEISEKLQNILGLGYALLNRGKLEISLGKYPQAVQTLQQALSHFNSVGTVHASRAQYYLGLAQHQQGAYDLAVQLYLQAQDGFKAANNQLEATRCLNGLGCLAYAQGRLHQAEQLQRESLAYLQATEPDSSLVALTLHFLGQVMLAFGENRRAEAREFLQQALALATERQLAPIALDVCVDVAQLLAHMGEIERAIELLVLVGRHEASTFETRERARCQLLKLDEHAQLAQAQAAQEQQERPDLWAVAQILMAELAGD
jgi:tetratricopeptide (TPR) repeat protein